MATAAHTILAPAVQTADCITVPQPANDTAPCWTTDRRACAILASMATQPPAGQWNRTRYGYDREEFWSFVGFRVECLEAIRSAYGHAALLHMDHTGEGEAFHAFCRSVTVTAAIDAIIAAAGQEG